MAKISYKEAGSNSHNILILDSSETIFYPIPFTEYNEVKVKICLSLTDWINDEPPSGTITTSNYREPVTTSNRFQMGFCEKNIPGDYNNRRFIAANSTNTETGWQSNPSSSSYIIGPGSQHAARYFRDNDGSYWSLSPSETGPFLLPSRNDMLSSSNFCSCQTFSILKEKSGLQSRPFQYTFRTNSGFSSNTLSDVSISTLISNNQSMGSYTFLYHDDINFKYFMLYNPFFKMRIRIHAVLIEKIS